MFEGIAHMPATAQRKNVIKLYEKIKLLRKERNLSQEELADKAGIHISYLSRLENGHNEPSVEVFKRLADALEVSTEYLLDENSDALEVRIENKTLLERFRLVESLDPEDQRVITHVIEALLTKKRMKELLAQNS
jgi:transcriptional regulator with XRE-family HTH domain